MKINSDYANKIIRNLQSEMSSLLEAEQRDCTYSHAPNEKPVIPQYDFQNTQQRLSELRRKIAVLRHAINGFNITTKLSGFDMTVDEGLGYMSILNLEKKRLHNLSIVPETARRREYGSKEPDIVHRNFDMEAVQAAYKETCNELMRIQQAVNIANLTEEFEVDLDLDITSII